MSDARQIAALACKLGFMSEAEARSCLEIYEGAQDRPEFIDYLIDSGLITEQQAKTLREQLALPPRKTVRRVKTRRAVAAPSSNPAPLIMLGVGIAVALVVILLVVISGGSPTPPPKPAEPPRLSSAPPTDTKTPAAPRPQSAAAQVVEHADRLLAEAKQKYEHKQPREALDLAERARNQYLTALDLAGGTEALDINERVKTTQQLMKLIRDSMTTSSPVVNSPKPPEPPKIEQQPPVEPEKKPDPKAEKILIAFRGWYHAPSQSDWRSFLTVDPASPLTRAFGAIATRITRGEAAPDPVLEKEFAVLHTFAEMSADEHVQAISRLLKGGKASQILALAHFEAVDVKHPSLPILATELKLIETDGRYGTREGHAVATKDLKAAEALPELTFYRAVVLLQQGEVEKSARTFTGITGKISAHAQELGKLLQRFKPCSSCKGTGRKPCPKCKGKGKLTLKCARCGGSGIKPATSSCCTGCCEQHKALPNPGCRGAGGKEVACEKGVDCGSCKGPFAPPTLDDLGVKTPCPLCRGTGLLFEKIAVVCDHCLGPGVLITPNSDPSKVLR